MTAKRLSQIIVNDLFCNPATGRSAYRLVLTEKDNRTFGGWIKIAAQKRIEQIISRHAARLREDDSQ